MILVTGATGHLGAAVVKHLIAKSPASQVAVLVRNESKADELKALGVIIRVGDYHKPESLEKAFAGVDKLLLISSSDFNDRFQQHKNAVDAAKKAGVKHIFYTGVTMRDIEKSPLKAFLDSHFQTEDYIKAQGLAYTFFRNSLYSEVIPMFVGATVLETGVFFPSGEGKVAFASRADLAEAIANVLAADGHEGKIYAFAGTQSYTFADVANILSQLSGKTVAFNSPEPAVFQQVLAQIGLPEPIVQMSLGFAAGIKNQDFADTSADLSRILGREPENLQSFLQKTYF